MKGIAFQDNFLCTVYGTRCGNVFLWYYKINWFCPSSSVFLHFTPKSCCVLTLWKIFSLSTHVWQSLKSVRKKTTVQMRQQKYIQSTKESHLLFKWTRPMTHLSPVVVAATSTAAKVNPAKPEPSLPAVVVSVGIRAADVSTLQQLLLPRFGFKCGILRSYKNGG